MRCYPPEQLRGEVAFIAHYLHWSYDELMGMDHLERRHWVDEVSAMNRRMNEADREQVREQGKAWGALT